MGENQYYPHLYIGGTVEIELWNWIQSNDLASSPSFAMDMAYDSGKNLFSSLDFIFLIYKMSMGVLYSTHRVNVSIKGIYACESNLKILSVMRQWSDTLFKDKNYNDFLKKLYCRRETKSS